MLPLKLCGHLGGCVQAVCSTHAGFFSRVGLPRCGATVLRCSQVDASCSDFQNIPINETESSDDQKKEKKAKKQHSSKLHSSHSFKKNTSRSGNDEGSHRNKVKSHLYSSIYPWTTKNELVDVLMQSQIFGNDDLLVLNKPYGVGQVNTGSRVTYGPAPPPFTLTDVLPILQELVRSPDLKITVSPEKWQSGVLVLTKNKRSSNKVEHCKRMATSLEVCMRQFWTVTRNRAYPSEKPYRVAALRGETITSGATVAVLEFTPSSNRVKKHLVDRFYATHSTLAESETTGTALIQVGVTRTMHHSVRVWLAHHLAPPLGDHLYGGRVAYLLDVPVPVPHNRVSSQPPYPFDLLKKIELSPSIHDLLPLMMHLRTVTLPCYYTGRVSNNKACDFGCFTDFNKDNSQSPETESRVQEAAELSKAAAIHDVDESPISSANEAHRFEDANHDDVKRSKFSKVEDSEDQNKAHAMADTSQSLIFTAPVPQHFSWTMERLGITVPSV